MSLRSNKKSDHALHDYIRKDNYTQANAPFGTLYTPKIRLKIIGGKPVHVVEGDSVEGDSSQQAQLTTRTQDATTNTDHVPRSESVGYSTANPDHFNSNIHPLQNYPQQSLNPHSVLPPIETRHPPHEGQLFKPILQQSVGPGSPLPPIRSPERRQGSHPLYGLLPRDAYLPKEPLFLRRDQEMALTQLLNAEVTKYHQKKLKDIYGDLTELDRNRTGYVAFQDLSLVFTKNQVFLPPQLLRLVAALYVSTKEYGLVNYEKVLIFISAAFKLANSMKNISPPPSPPPAQHIQENSRELNIDSPRPTVDRPSYYNPGISPGPPDQRLLQSPRSPNRNKDDAKLIRLIEIELLQHGKPFDVEKLHASLSEMDRTHRGTLSKQQLKQVARLCGLPLQESLIDRIIERCEDRGLGQYDWQQFQEFIERVQPAMTGLRIPTGKKPRDYAKQYPVPGSNWPRAESDVLSPRQNSPDHSHMHNTVQYQTPNAREIQKLEKDVNRMRQLGSMEKELRELEERYQEMKGQLLQEQRYGPKQTEKDLHRSPNANKSWFQRFLKLVDALYKNDVDHKGRLCSAEVQSLTDLYDRVYELNIPDNQKKEAILEAGPDGNLVDIDLYVRILGMNNAM